jgi:hypothetical protein
MAVSNEDVLEGLPACFDPLDDLRRLLSRHRRIDQDRIVLARNKGGGNVLKHLALAVRRGLGPGERNRIRDVKLVVQLAV